MNRGGSFLITPLDEYKILTPEHFTEDHRDFREAVLDFAQETIKPRANDIEKLDESLTRNLFEQMGEMGMLGVDIPEEFGGLGLDKTAAALVVEALAYSGSGSLLVTYSDHTGIALFPILWYGNQAQRKKYIPEMMSGKSLGSYALTEPGAGSDALNSNTSAVLSDDGKYYILNGTKQFITNGSWADIGVVFAKVDGTKFTAFILDRTMEGWKRGPEEHKIGIKGSSTTTYIMDNCKIPVENVIGKVGSGAGVAFNVLYIGRLKLGAVTMGAGKAMIKEALDYAKERKQFAQSISNFGMLQSKFAEMIVGSFEAETVTYATTGALDANIEKLADGHPDYYIQLQQIVEDHAIETSINKVLSSEVLFHNVDEGLQVLGGYGYTEEYPFARYYRDERINRIFEGTNEINRLIIGGTMLKKAIMEEIPLRDAISKIGDSWVQQHENKDAMRIDLARTILLVTLNDLILKYGQDFKSRQWMIKPFADIVIAFQVMTAVYARKVAADGSSSKSIIDDIATASIDKRFIEITNSADIIWRHILCSDDIKKRKKSLNDALDAMDYFPDVVTLRQNIFNDLMEKGEYNFG
jgi:alkylation response protein AidB-like acyl-CoA dehydrogenase